MRQNQLRTSAWLWLAVAVFALSDTSQASRIAVLHASGLEDAAAILTSALSSTPGIEVVERDKMNEILRERKLPVQNLGPGQMTEIGRLLRAQALLILDRPVPGRTFSSRLIASEPCIVVEEHAAVWPMEDPAAWAATQARKYASSLVRIPTEPGRSRLLAVLGVRSTTSGPESRLLERQTLFSVLPGKKWVF